MACKCKKAKTIAGNNIVKEKLTEPYETCPQCALKHISYAIVNFYNVLKCLSEVYLAYKHLERYFKDEAKLCFEFIEDYFNSKYDKDKLEKITEIIHNLAINYNEDIVEGEPLNLENKLNSHQRAALYILAASELYNYEAGYKDVNAPYVIGLLQNAAEAHIEENVDEKFSNNLRLLWKKIENGEKLLPADFRRYALDQITFDKLN